MPATQIDNHLSQGKIDMSFRAALFSFFVIIFGVALMVSGDGRYRLCSLDAFCYFGSD